MKGIYDNIIIGAGLNGLGLAYANKNSIILEATEMVGREYTGSFAPATHTGTDTCLKEGAKKLRERMSARGIINNAGAINPLALAPILYGFVKDEAIKIIFLAGITQIAYSGGVYRVTCYTNSGRREIEGRRIIDTTDDCAGCGTKKLRVICHSPADRFEQKLDAAFADGAEVLRGFNADEYNIGVNFPAETTMAHARDLLHKGWAKAFPSGEALITATAFHFHTKSQTDCKHLANDMLLMPASFYSEPITAFDAGERAAQAKEGDDAVS